MMSPRLQAIDGYRDALGQAAAQGLEDEVERKLAKADLFYLLTVVLGRKDLDHDWLFARCREVQAEPNGYLDLWPREHYKDLADCTPILTHNRGWVPHGSLSLGDQVYDDAGKPVGVIALSDRYTDSECYRLTFSDGAQIVAGAGHLWRVRRKHRLRVGDWRAGRREVSWDSEIIPTVSLPKRADIGALQEPITGVPQQLLVDPYVLGVWLGDGSAGGTRITAGHDDADEMHRLLSGRGVQVERTTHDAAVSLRIGSGRRGDRASSDFANSLRKLGVYKDKHIPRCYFEASAHQRMMLLRGLMDTDGHCGTRGTAVFVNANEVLARDVCELAIGLALRPRFRRYQHNTGPYKGNVFYQVAFQAHKDRVPFSVARKVSRAIEPSAHRNCRDVVSVERIESVPTRCIQVEGGVYLAGRELIPTHNSSIITFGLTIQDILNNPEGTFGIFSFTRPIAKAFLRQIKRELESNERLRTLFPDIIWENPQRDAPKWSEDDGIIVKRKGNPKESTVEAWGVVDGQPTSKHFGTIIYDDLVTRDSVTNPEMVEKVTEAWASSRALGTAGGATRYSGTRWAYLDPYRIIIDRKAVIERRHTVTVDGTVEGEPVLRSREWIAEKRREMGPFVFSAQMLLDPAADRAQGFQESWLRYYPNSRIGDFEGLNKYLLVDPANDKKKQSDFTAMAVIGLGSDENYYLLDAIRDRLNLRERADAVFSLHRRWKPRGVGYEKYGMQADVDYLKERMGQENYRFEITEVGGRLSKIDRIRRMIPIFAPVEADGAGRFLLPETLVKEDYEGIRRDLIQNFILEEYNPFPVGIHDDLFDAISRIWDIPTVWPKPINKENDRYARARPRRRPTSAWAA